MIDRTVFVGGVITVTCRHVHHIKGSRATIVHKGHVIETFPKAELRVYFVQNLLRLTPMEIFGLYMRLKDLGMFFVFEFAKITLDNTPMDMLARHNWAQIWIGDKCIDHNFAKIFFNLLELKERAI